ncbi:MAG: threonine--tRNA ligase [Planctomycetota bacterium]|nr:threonine--tRNA ligase [Planctomycetota bacterium]MDA1247784.1 threonine--tRNA ligase [Planctomycetota bacterium]
MIQASSDPLEIQLPDGTVKEYSGTATALDVASDISEGLARAVVAVKVEDTIFDSMRPLSELTEARPIPLTLLTTRDPEALGVLRHSCAHVMARAVMRLFEGVGLAFGPTTDNGFYYDFDLATPIREDDFAAIEAEMKKIVKEGEAFERFSLSREEAIALCDDLKQELKVEHISGGLAEHETLSFYRQGEFVDLCRGPHIPNAGKIKAFKLLSLAGAHWKGDQSARPLQRLYGTAFFDKKDQKAYLDQVEEAKRRDHRVLGKKLRLFEIEPDVGQGLCLWLPKGATIRVTLEDFIKKELLERGYQPVYSPHIGRVDMYETSGHFPYYRDSQFAPIFGHSAGQLVDYWVKRLDEIDETPLNGEEEQKLLDAAKVLGFNLEGFSLSAAPAEKRRILHEWEKTQERYLLKPMNCPHHVNMYKSQPRSYRELPLRLAEFGTVYRHEQTGELNGMLRVRGLTQDDAHIFCTPEQVEQEFRDTIDLVRFVLKSVGLDNYRAQLSLRDSKNKDKYVGDDALWDNAEETLRRVLEESGLNFKTEEGEAAFYGPKVDFMVRDCIGREWQLGTVQLDYNLPARFKLEYIGPDNKPHQPVMIHRAPFGSLERFVGMLIEHYAGAFPLWLAPEQVRILPLSDKSADYAIEVQKQFKAAGFRVSTDLHDSRLQAKIRDAQIELIPYMLVVGPKEAEAGAVAVRDRIDGDVGVMPIAEAIARLTEEVTERRIRQVAESTFSGFGGSEHTDNEY